MKQIILSITALLILSGAAMAGDATTTTFKDEKSPEVVAQYKTQCAKWADQNQFTGSERDAYMEDCLKDMPSIQPYGYGKDE